MICYKAKDIVQVIKNVPKLDILPGDNFKISYQSSNKKVKS